MCRHRQRTLPTERPLICRECDPMARTALILHRAFTTNNPAVLHDPNIRDDDGNTLALAHAICVHSYLTGDGVMLRRLISEGVADLNAQNNAGESLLYLMQSSPAIRASLLTQTHTIIDVNVRTVDGSSVISKMRFKGSDPIDGHIDVLMAYVDKTKQVCSWACDLTSMIQRRLQYCHGGRRVTPTYKEHDELWSRRLDFALRHGVMVPDKIELSVPSRYGCVEYGSSATAIKALSPEEKSVLMRHLSKLPLEWLQAVLDDTKYAKQRQIVTRILSRRLHKNLVFPAAVEIPKRCKRTAQQADAADDTPHTAALTPPPRRQLPEELCLMITNLCL